MFLNKILIFVLNWVNIGVLVMLINMYIIIEIEFILFLSKSFVNIIKKGWSERGMLFICKKGV